MVEQHTGFGRRLGETHWRTAAWPGSRSSSCGTRSSRHGRDQRDRRRGPRTRPAVPRERRRPGRGWTCRSPQRPADHRGHLGPPAGDAPVLAVIDSDEADDEDRALLAQLHPTARRVPAASAELARAALAGFDVEAAAAAQHPACALLPQDADEAGVTTFVWHRRRPFHPERLYHALEDLCCVAARSRGRFWLADRPDTLLAWDAAGGALCVESAGPSDGSPTR